MMLLMMIAILGMVLVIGLIASAAACRLRPWQSAPSEQRRLAEQAEHIEVLEEELQRVKDQADFTERLLAGRGSTVDGRVPSLTDMAVSSEERLSRRGR